MLTVACILLHIPDTSDDKPYYEHAHGANPCKNQLIIHNVIIPFCFAAAKVQDVINTRKCLQTIISIAAIGCKNNQNFSDSGDGDDIIFDIRQKKQVLFLPLQSPLRLLLLELPRQRCLLECY